MKILAKKTIKNILMHAFLFMSGAIFAGQALVVKSRSDDQEQKLDLQLLGAVHHDDAAAVIKLIKRGADARGADANVRCIVERLPPIYFAARDARNIAVFQALIRAGADVDHTIIKFYGDASTPLLDDVFGRRNSDAIIALLSCGADANRTDRFDETLLHKIARSGEAYLALKLFSSVCPAMSFGVPEIVSPSPTPTPRNVARKCLDVISSSLRYFRDKVCTSRHDAVHSPARDEQLRIILAALIEQGRSEELKSKDIDMQIEGVRESTIIDEMLSFSLGIRHWQELKDIDSLGGSLHEQLSALWYMLEARNCNDCSPSHLALARMAHERELPLHNPSSQFQETSNILREMGWFLDRQLSERVIKRGE